MNNDSSLHDSALDDASLHGRTVLVTGATQGLGRALALDLAGEGATLLLHGRNPERLEKVLAEVRAVGAEARGYLADFSDLAQVRALAQRIAQAEPELNVLVHNAIARNDPKLRQLSAQGHELQLAVNHLVPWTLTRLLLPLLRVSAAHSGRASRVVNVASMGQAPLDLADPMMEQEYDGLTAYCRSKLALIMATFDLGAELPAHEVTVNTLHPAHLMDTEGVRAFGLVPAVSVAEGVRPTVRLVTDPELAGVTGRYFDRFTEARAHDWAYDPAARAELAALTQRLTTPFTAPLG
ncbi:MULTISPECIES: SDR family NAD(P)-dependent oxidoreductase [Kitasatospora]|uniref:SDR family NAD(P)-dependent oxidoreductase n=1 Tax=Kitasatospora TaxID=2063 RepID=UPI000C70A2BD|nr:SDR family NAD(P)-dependent oxidoreductase [Kitasatospora sp. GP30]MDH6140079.1 NAD(P)-dependent dehydrogenase (short-subunit alcohol dehydrogenase family) [Kitasatospora sp. GP30]